MFASHVLRRTQRAACFQHAGDHRDRRQSLQRDVCERASRVRAARNSRSSCPHAAGHDSTACPARLRFRSARSSSCAARSRTRVIALGVIIRGETEHGGPRRRLGDRCPPAHGRCPTWCRWFTRSCCCDSEEQAARALPRRPDQPRHRGRARGREHDPAVRQAAPHLSLPAFLLTMSQATRRSARRPCSCSSPMTCTASCATRIATRFWQLHSAKPGCAQQARADDPGHHGQPPGDRRDASPASVQNYSVRPSQQRGPQHPPPRRLRDSCTRRTVPPAVVINEAIEIANRFATEESGRFVNGVLDRIARNVAAACRAPKPPSPHPDPWPASSRNSSSASPIPRSTGMTWSTSSSRAIWARSWPCRSSGDLQREGRRLCTARTSSRSRRSTSASILPAGAAPLEPFAGPAQGDSRRRGERHRQDHLAPPSSPACSKKRGHSRRPRRRRHLPRGRRRAARRLVGAHRRSPGERRLPTPIPAPSASMPTRPPRNGTRISSSATPPAACTRGTISWRSCERCSGTLGKTDPTAPHEVLLVVDATTGGNALQQAREFHKAVPAHRPHRHQARRQRQGRHHRRHPAGTRHSHALRRHRRGRGRLQTVCRRGVSGAVALSRTKSDRINKISDAFTDRRFLRFARESKRFASC